MKPAYISRLGVGNEKHGLHIRDARLASTEAQSVDGLNPKYHNQLSADAARLGETAEACSEQHAQSIWLALTWMAQEEKNG